MLSFSEQFNIVQKVVLSFKSGKKVEHIKKNSKEYNRAKLFLNPEKYKHFTKQNFAYIVIHTAFKRNITSPLEMFKILNELKKLDISKALILKSESKSYDFIIDKDSNTIKTRNIDVYKAYKKNIISPFYLAEFYEQNKDKIKGRIMEKEIKNAKVLTSFFNKGKNDDDQ